MICRTFVDALRGMMNKEAIGKEERTNRDMNMGLVLGMLAVLIILIAVLPVIPIGVLGAIIIVIFGFFFAAVSSRMVGLVGSSNNPVSGMAIATLLITSLILKATGNSGASGMVAAIAIGSVICIVAAMARRYVSGS